jgi:hypothetical protein
MEDSIRARSSYRRCMYRDLASRTGHPMRTDLVDEAMDRYVDWREESASVEEAYARHATACRGQGTVAFAAYRAALDREECAAGHYADALLRLRTEAERPRSESVGAAGGELARVSR